MTRSILLIDDDQGVRTLLRRFFEGRGWGVEEAEAGEPGLELYERERPDLVLLDLELPGGRQGLDVLEELRRRDPDAAVVMLTGHGDIATAVEAMRLGAENFLTKPATLAHLEAAAERAYEKVAMRRRIRYFAERQTEVPGLAALGRSPQMRELAHRIELLAAGDTTVLLLGETGTGKGWVAQLMHRLSARSAAPFVEVNCGGLTATFLDSELFGHERGAFTDAKAQKRGLFEIAHTGTLFLDEVGDLAPELQPKLLKVLEDRRFRRLGGTKELEVDVRVLAATNHQLEDEVRAGKFREDLYYRLAILPLRLPPLRERAPTEVADLTLTLLLELRRRMGRGPARLAPDALGLRVRCPWPGNIRELRNVLERALILAGNAEELRPEHLPADLFDRGAGPGELADPTLALEEIERRHIGRALAHHGGNRSRAARSLGISRATLYEKIRKYGIG
ncbi:MAG: sigma-54-dependent Fis family transcriptional regulator [Gemmatimonadetes bacterium]|nr:sigma-54-dependent Fis family transcriptional regulator [Gemmatimonadota bacterium]